MSVRSDGNEVSVRPSTTSASISTQGAWQIAATGFACSKKSRTKSTTASLARSLSAPTQPPGITSASKSVRPNVVSSWVRLALFEADDRHGAAGFLNCGFGLGEFRVLRAAGRDQDRDCLAFEDHGVGP